MAGWHHWLNGHESEWTLGVGDGQGGLVCCNSWGRKQSDMTEWLNWTEWLNFSANWFIIEYERLFWQNWWSKHAVENPWLAAIWSYATGQYRDRSLCHLPLERCGAVVYGRDVPCNDRKASDVWDGQVDIMEWTVFGVLFSSQHFVSLQPSTGTQGWAVMSVIYDLSP